MEGEGLRWWAVFKGRTAMRMTCGSIQPTRKWYSWETTAECGTPTTAAANGGKEIICQCRSFITSAWTITIHTVSMAVYRTTVRGWANRSITAASTTRSGKPGTTDKV